MLSPKDFWRKRIYEELKNMALAAGAEFSMDENQMAIEKPPRPDMGDMAFPLFQLAKLLRKGPPQIAQELAGKIASGREGSVRNEGPYLNVRFGREYLVEYVLGSVFSEGEGYGRTDTLAGQKIIVEFSCPNTNKPLHLGHLRNNTLGESLSRVLKAAGAEVCKVNLINDRGVHICKSMLAYKKFGNGSTPESAGRKSDHFVGDWYVRYSGWAKEDSAAETEAQAMLLEWENGSPEVLDLWKTMNGWAVDGINETYDKTGISFDRVYYESQTYLSGREEVLKGLEKGIFYKDDKGGIRLDLSDIGLDTKVLLRADGTSVYITQDLGTAIARHCDWPFDRMIYVVASEQEYHFKVLFHALKRLGYPWAAQLHHLSYGMVNLPEGKMKSREGTVVDADNLLAQLTEMALREIREKEREGELTDPEGTAFKIALAAVHYFLLQVSPQKDMIFNPRESLSFNGDTGPYLQYMTARISSLVAKVGLSGATPHPDWKKGLASLDSDEESELVQLLMEYPEKIRQAAGDLNPSVVAAHCHDMARAFSRFYHEKPVLGIENKELSAARLALAQATLQVLRNALDLLNIPFLEKM
jgi:arginyl-tRNA synthetase